MKVYPDDVRGHFLIELDREMSPPPQIVGCDLGAVLALTTSGAYLRPDEAREVARMLNVWADRKHTDEVDDMRTAEINDLFDLLDERPGKEG